MNRYWRSVNGRVLIAAAGRRYRTDVELAYRLQSATGGGCGSMPVEVSIDAWLPDQRRRDIDNILKAPLDALTHAGLWDDDYQVMGLAIRKVGMDRKRPRLEISITEAAQRPASINERAAALNAFADELEQEAEECRKELCPPGVWNPIGMEAVKGYLHTALLARDAANSFERQEIAASRARAFSEPRE
ncbi:hypothetical protein NB710_001193 [Xanthomonas sacchari]|nr:hypothetical protein [Xanthomonas sacchari]